MWQENICADFLSYFSQLPGWKHDLLVVVVRATPGCFAVAVLFGGFSLSFRTFSFLLPPVDDAAAFEDLLFLFLHAPPFFFPMMKLN